MNGVVKMVMKMEYPNDQPRDLPHFHVQIEGLSCWVGKGRNTARACLVWFVACSCGVVWSTAAVSMNANAFLHSSSFSTRLQFYNLQIFIT